MISIEETKRILKDKTISDEEAEIIRDEFRALAEIIFEKYQSDKIMTEKQKSKGFEKTLSIL